MFEVRLLTTSDAPAALRLSEQAGWNQLSVDWERMLALWPQGCLAGWSEGDLVATATLASYGGAVGWIGMILVDEACRGRGLGGRMFDATVELGRQQRLALLGLDATDLGRPVYAKRGFSDHSPIDRWVGQGTGGARTVEARTRPLAEPDWPSVLSIDRTATSLDRGPLLRRLTQEPGARARVAVEQGRVHGFGCARRGRHADAVGPIVAESVEAGLTLLEDLCADRRADADDPARPILLDVPRGSALAEALPSRGFVLQRRLTRMACPAYGRPLLNGAQVLAGAGFELG